MYYETKSFEELVNKMASCENLGLYYVVQKDIVETQKKRLGFLPNTKYETLYKLQVVQYEEESGTVGEEEVLHGRPCESEADGVAEVVAKSRE